MERKTPHVQRVMVGTDWSNTAERAVEWAADFAERFGAELYLVQVIDHNHNASGNTEHIQATTDNLIKHARSMAGDRGRGRVIVSDDPAMAVVRAAATDSIDVLVVGNTGMLGRKEFLLGNVPNRISHNARCTVIIVNTLGAEGYALPETAEEYRAQDHSSSQHRTARMATIAEVFAKHGLRELFAGAEKDNAATRRRQAVHLRDALEELGPTFAKIGQLLSTRPDLLPPEFIEELTRLQDRVTPLTEEQVVRVMEQDLAVPWEDLFEMIDREPLASGSIGQVHRASLTSGDKVVVKVQRSDASELVTQDLALFKLFVEQVGTRPGLRRVFDMPAVFEHLSKSLKRELDFHLEARNAERMREVLTGFERLAVPTIYPDVSTARLLVMQDVRGVPLSGIPSGPLRQEIARQLVESYCNQILVHGFFHADPHPGNLMWQPVEQRLYFLDLGSVGEVDSDTREVMILVLTAFWQGDSQFLSNCVVMLSEKTHREPDVEAFGKDMAAVVAKYRGAAVGNIQLGAILQEIIEISFRHGVVLPGSLTLTAKALAQMQAVTSQLDPALDPFDVAGRYMTRWLVRRTIAASDPKALFYEMQKLKVRAGRFFESLERLVGAQPGQKTDFNFRAMSLELAISRAGRRFGLGLAAGFALVATAVASSSDRSPLWVTAAFGLVCVGFLLGLVVDVVRRQG